jgi:hypothetical protein
LAHQTPSGISIGGGTPGTSDPPTIGSGLGVIVGNDDQTFSVPKSISEPKSTRALACFDWKTEGCSNLLRRNVPFANTVMLLEPTAKFQRRP